MKHETFPGSARRISEKEKFESVIAKSEALIERSDYGPVEMSTLPEGFTCTKVREDSAVDKYVFIGDGMRLVLMHDRTHNRIEEPFTHPEVEELDAQSKTMKEIEDQYLDLCKNALESHLSSTR